MIENLVLLIDGVVVSRQYFGCLVGLVVDDHLVVVLELCERTVETARRYASYLSAVIMILTFGAIIFSTG
ncbi:hypothetical protein [Halorientalis regularis]|uniref:hypothetical protein n=1 Tax=Halorientalis regularis TaxID=660518 RepID=UPI000B84853D|nr:hypothetical protein [Halorientalis regularis]